MSWSVKSFGHFENKIVKVGNFASEKSWIPYSLVVKWLGMKIQKLGNGWEFSDFHMWELFNKPHFAGYLLDNSCIFLHNPAKNIKPSLSY